MKLRFLLVDKLELDDYMKIHELFDADVLKVVLGEHSRGNGQSLIVLVSQVWDFETSVEQYAADGGTARVAVEKQIADMRAQIAK